MISPTAEYALRAIVAIAQQRGEPLTNPQIAVLTSVPEGYLAKVMQKLVRGRIVRSRRGLGGGFTLYRPAEETSVLEVVNAVDPIVRIHSCPLKIAEHGTHLCALHRRMDEAIAAYEQCFGETTIAELLAEPGERTPLCEAGERPVVLNLSRT